MSISPPLRKTLHRLANLWPADPLRPELSFPTLLHSRADGNVHGTTSTPTNSPQRTVTADGSKVVANGPLRAGDSPPEQQVNAIAVLLEGRFGKMYPVSDRTLKPGSNPDYYTKLLQELEEAPTRSPMEGFLNSWKGWIKWT